MKWFKKEKTVILALVYFLFLLPFSAGAESTIILDTFSSWRFFFPYSTVLIADGSKLKKAPVELNTQLPPADWNSADFDDTSWTRTSELPFSSWSTYVRAEQLNVGFMESQGGSIAIPVICFRGKFSADPAKAGKMNLALTYRGGVVVYVNGKEVARGHLPKEGKIDANTPGDIYPKEVYLSDKGALLDKNSPLEQLEERLRVLDNISIPRELLRKGTNVLAIEVHRSPLPKEVYDKVKSIRDERQVMKIFDGCGLISAQLTAPGGGVPSNVARPGKTQLWNSPSMATDYDTDWGDPTEVLKPIQLAGAGNGSFSGKVVIGSTSPLRKVKGVVTDLTGKNGGKIPAAALQIRYAAASAGFDENKPARIENLLEVPPLEVPVRVLKPSNVLRSVPGYSSKVPGAVLPLWVTVNVPADTKADDYEGELKITMDNGGPFTVPVRIRVYNYDLPKPRDFTTFAEIVQSPETLAIVYKVPLWSEKHWKLIEKSISYLGALGTKTCYIPLICKTNMGNAESMVRWVKDKDKYSYDFSVMDKYLDLVEKYQGKIPVVCFYVWDIFVKEGEHVYDQYLPKEVNASLAEAAGKGPEVTLLNTAGGKTEEINLPKFSDPKAASYWKPLVDQLKDRMKKRGLEKSIMLGIITDSAPEPVIAKFWQEMFPDANWVKHAHNRGSYNGKGGGNALGYTGTVWDRSTLIDTLGKTDKAGKGWKSKEFSTFFPRDLRNSDPIATFRMMGEICSFGGQRGFARQGADFWSISGGTTVDSFTGMSSGVIASDGRFTASSWRNLNIRTSLLGPGPEGAIATARYEMMREGVQECEARIAVEKALEEGKMRADMAKRCEKILAERNQAIYGGFYDNRSDFLDKKGGGFTTYNWSCTPPRYNIYFYLSSGWQERSADLYEAAALIAGGDKKAGFSVSYRDLLGSSEKESFDKEVKVGLIPVKVETNPFIPGENKVTFKFYTEKLTIVNAGIYNDKKELIRKLTAGEAHSKWNWEISWDGMDDKGLTVTEGKYLAKLAIGDKEGTVTVGILKKTAAEEKKEEE